MRWMYQKLGALVVTLFAVVLLAGPVATRAQEEEEVPYGLNPVPEVVEPGQFITFIGFGYNSVEQVKTWATSPFGEGFQGEQTLSFDDGVIFFSYQVPEGAQLGRWAMTASGDDSRLELVTYFDVVAAGTAPPNPIATGEGTSIVPVFPDVEAGGLLDFVLIGYKDKEGIEGWATDPSGVAFGGSYTYADSQGGRALVTFLPPEDAMNGYWSMTARGESSALQATTSFLMFNGVDQANAVPYLTAIPSSAPAGQMFTFAARGFDPGEEISYSINGPGKKFTVLHGPTADMNGEVIIEWTAPDNAFPGTWSMSLRGLLSSHWLGIRFDVTPAAE